jgi:hypothetical protein
VSFSPVLFTLLRVATRTSEHSLKTFNICVFVVDSHRMSEGVFINNLWTVCKCSVKRDERKYRQ